MFGFVSFLCCFVAALQAANGSFVPVCQLTSNRNALGPKLPTFPSAFSTFVEVNIVNKNYTSFYKELYDLQANQGRLERTKDGRTLISIYDYNLDERISVDLNSKNCSVSSINGSRRNFFGSNNSHIESVSQLFKFAKQYNETYMGVASVRGIECNHWRACITVQNFSSYNLDYYFSVPGWKTTWQHSTVVRAVINGSRSARTPNGKHDFYHVYDFINFHPGRPDPSNFQLPEGYYCKGLKGENKTVPKVPSVFSLEFENVWSGNISNHSLYIVSNWKEIYDFEKKLVLLKLPNWHNSIGGPVILIHDFNTGIRYNISTGKSGTVCAASLLTAKNADNWFAADAGHHHIRMKTTHDLFNTPQRNGSSPLVYKGSASVRGINADIWVGKTLMKDRTTNESHEVVMEWYFSKPNWRVMSGSQHNQHQVPVRLDWYSQRGHVVMNMFNFDAEAAETTAFDIKPCLKWDEQRFIQFGLSGKYDEYGGSRKFLLALTKTISTVANVSIIRVNGIRLQNNRGAMIVTFILLNKTKPVGGDVEVTVYSEKGLMAALDALKDSVESGKFKLEFQNKTFDAAKSSFFVGLRPTRRPRPPAHSTAKPTGNPGGSSTLKTKGVSSGAAAGISILMLAVGIGGGLLIAHVIMKRRGTSLFQYQRQE